MYKYILSLIFFSVLSLFAFTPKTYAGSEGFHEDTFVNRASATCTGIQVYVSQWFQPEEELNPNYISWMRIEVYNRDWNDTTTAGITLVDVFE